MIPPQLAIFAAKHAKKLLIVLAVLIVIAGVWFAVKMHERTVEKLAESEAARAAQVMAHETTLASLEIQKQAAAQWQASAKKYQGTLNEQKRMQAAAAEEGRRLSETLRDHDLERLAREKPSLLERTINRGTARIIGLLNCSSTARGCDGDRGAAGPDSADSVSSPTVSGDVRMDGDGSRLFSRSGRSLFLPSAPGLRSSST